MLEVAKRTETKFGAKAAAEESVSRFVPYTRHIDDTTLRTKEGYLFKTIKLEGLPFETADQIDLNTRKNIRATLLQGLSNSRFALYHHIIRREATNGSDNFFKNDWCRELDAAYQNRLSKKRMFVNEQYITIVRRPAQSKIGFFAELTQTLFSSVDHQFSHAKQEENHKALNEAVSNILTTLKPYKPKLLGMVNTERGIFSENLSFLSYLINLEKTDIRLPEMALDKYLPTKRISFGKETLEIRGAAPTDTKLAAVLSLKEYANATGPGMLDGLLRLPHEFILTQSFGFVDRQTSLSSMNEAMRKMIASEEGANSLIEDIEEARDNLASGRFCFGEHHLTLTSIAKNSKDLDKALSSCVSELVNLGIVSVREDINLEPAYWANLPGNFSYIARRSLISNNNFAGFASLHNFPSGRKTGNHWGKAITQLETTSGTPYWFNFHERDVGNFTVIGPTGTGKTVLLTFLLAQAQKLNPKAVYFDKDRGAEIFIRAIGGDYTVVQAGKPTGLNPLSLPDTPENRSFLREWIRVLATSENNTALTPQELDIIADAINANYETKPKNRRLAYLAELLSGYDSTEKYSLASRIAKWHSSGERAWLFDNETDELALDNQTIGFDLTSILDDSVSRTPWLMYIFHRVNTLLDGQKTILMLDEGWKMLDDPAFAARIKDWMKTIRKQNGILGFATQSAKDALKSSVGDAIIEQSPTQIFLPNARASEEDYCQGFGLSKHELKIIRNLTPQSRSFLIRHGTDSVIAKLDLTDLDEFIAVLSGRTESVQTLEKLMEEHGKSPESWLPHFTKRGIAA